MRYAFLIHNEEPAEGEIPAEAIEEMQRAFGAYGRALQEAGVLVGADILACQEATTAVTRRNGSLQVQDGPFAATKEALAGVFVVDVPDLDAALGWAEKCPAASYAMLEVRPVATSCVAGEWTA